ncbi:MAG: hypothetical protein ACRBFS_14295 [Aureispira sp.]
MNNHSPILMPLQIPQNWAILYNSFYQERPRIVEGEIENNLAYKEEVLSMVQVTYQTGKGYQIQQEGYWLDLGWYPDSDPEGNYKLVLFKKNWDTILVVFQSKEQATIQAAINQLLHLFYRYPQEQAIQLFQNYQSS